MAARIDIWNAALDAVREEPLLSTEDTGEIGKWFTRNYEMRRDELLRLHPWNFALSRRSLAADSTAPAFGWKFRYKIPSDIIRVMPLRFDGEHEGAPIPHEIEDGYILCDQTAPLKIRGVKRVTEDGLFDALFVGSLSAYLAMHFSHWETGKANLRVALEQSFNRIFNEARRLDSLEGTPERVNASSVIDVRRRYGVR